MLQISQRAQCRHPRGSHHVLVHLRASSQACVPLERSVAFLKHPMQDLAFIDSDDKGLKKGQLSDVCPKLHAESLFQVLLFGVG